MNDIEHASTECQCMGKLCTKCQQIRCVGNFTKDKRLRSGLKSQCRICASAQSKQWREEHHAYDLQRHHDYHEVHADREREAQKKYRAKNMEQMREKSRQRYWENAEQERERSLQWYHENKDKCRARRQRPDVRDKEYAAWKIYYRENKAYHNTRVRRWQQENPRMHAAKEAARRARKAKAGGKYTAQQWEELCTLYGYCCLCCGRNDVELHADHIIPIVKGGHSSIDNIQPLCKSCNSSKGTKIIDYRNKQA